jgi:hypothetical protein
MTCSLPKDPRCSGLNWSLKEVNPRAREEGSYSRVLAQPWFSSVLLGKKVDLDFSCKEGFRCLEH